LINLLVLCLGILENETVCLYKIKNSVGRYLGKEKTSPNSHYKRLIRIFNDFAFSRLWLDLLGLVFKLLRLKCTHLVLDGTSWKRGNKWKHYLVLSIVYQGVAIPIYWEDLQKHGNSNFKERKRLFKKAMRYFDLEGKTLLADREYIGDDWLKFLISFNIDFIIRVRHKNYKKAVNNTSGKTYEELKAKVLRSKVSGKSIKKRINIDGQELSFIVMKNPKADAKEPLLYFISNLDLPAPNIVCQYPIRWQIEMCFKHMKSNGFNLEEINVAGKAKQRLMMAVVVFAYTLSILEGLKTYKTVGTKKYASGKEYKAVSVFRYGLDNLMNQCHSFIGFCLYIIQELIDFVCTYRSKKSLFVQ